MNRDEPRAATPPVGMYRITMVTTGLDVGPDVLALTISTVLHNVLSLHPLIERVERIDTAPPPGGI